MRRITHAEYAAAEKRGHVHKMADGSERLLAWTDKGTALVPFSVIGKDN